MEDLGRKIRTGIAILFILVIFVLPAIFPEGFLLISLFLHPLMYGIAIFSPPTYLEHVPDFNPIGCALFCGVVGFVIGKINDANAKMSAIAMIVFWVPIMEWSSFVYMIHPNIRIDQPETVTEQSNNSN